MAAASHALEVTPESALQFVLTRDGPSGNSGADPTARCTMTLRHTGQTTESIAFKVSWWVGNYWSVGSVSTILYEDLCCGRLDSTHSGEMFPSVPDRFQQDE